MNTIQKLKRFFKNLFERRSGVELPSTAYAALNRACYKCSYFKLLGKTLVYSMPGADAWDLPGLCKFDGSGTNGNFPCKYSNVPTTMEFRYTFTLRKGRVTWFGKNKRNQQCPPTLPVFVSGKLMQRAADWVEASGRLNWGDETKAQVLRDIGRRRAEAVLRGDMSNFVVYIKKIHCGLLRPCIEYKRIMKSEWTGKSREQTTKIMDMKTKAETNALMYIIRLLMGNE